MENNEYTQHASMYLGGEDEPEERPDPCTLLYIFDRDEKLQTILKHAGDDHDIAGNEYTQHATMYLGGEGNSEERPGCCPYWDALYIEDLNNEHEFSFVIPGNHPDAQYVQTGGLVAFIDPDGYFQLFEVIVIEQHHSDESKIVVTCQHASLEMLDDHHIDDLRPTEVTARYALDQALQNTRWQSGQVDELGLNSVRFYRENPMSAVLKVANTWGGELRFRVVITNSQITARYVDLLTQRGSSNGKRFEYQKDVEEVIRTEDFTGVKTALYGYGKGEETGDGFGRRITFDDVEWSTANGDPADKALGQTWVGDLNARDQYGRPNGSGPKRHRFGKFEDPEEEDPAILLQKTWDHLQEERKKIKFTYEVKAIDLEQLTDQFGDKLDHEKVRLGDMVYVINRDFSPALEVQARIVQIKRYLSEPERTELVLGNFIPLFTDDDRVDRIEQRLNDRTGIWDNKYSPGDPIDTSWLQGVIDVLQNEVQSVGGYVYITDEDGLIVYDKPKNQNPTKAIQLKGGVLAIANSKNPDGTWKWRTFGTGDGFVADLITAGSMLADRIRGGQLTLGGMNDEAGIFRLLDEEYSEIIRMTKEGIQLSDGARIMGSQGILSVLQFVSSDQWNGWSDIGLIDGPQIEKGRSSVTIPVPDNFVIEKATLTLEAMPVYYNDVVRNVTKWKQSRNLRLYRADGNDGFFDYPYPGHPWVDWRSGTNITSAVWGVSSWSPPISPSNSPIIQYRSGDVKQYLTPGEETTFYVETTDGATESNFDNNQGLGRLVVSIEGFARPEN